MSKTCAFISLTTAPQTMARNEKIPFNVMNVMHGLTYSAQQRQLTVTIAGLYHISFGYHHTRSQQFVITVNGTSLGDSYITNGQTINGIVYLHANDTVTMMKSDATDTTNHMTAFLTLSRMR